MSKLKLENYSVSVLPIQEKMDTIGGDPFLRDLGAFFGDIVGSIGNYFDTQRGSFSIFAGNGGSW